MHEHGWALPACLQADLVEKCGLAFASAVQAHRRRRSAVTTLDHIPEAVLGLIAAHAFAIPQRT